MCAPFLFPFPASSASEHFQERIWTAPEYLLTRAADSVKREPRNGSMMAMGGQRVPGTGRTLGKLPHGLPGRPNLAAANRGLTFRSRLFEEHPGGVRMNTKRSAASFLPAGMAAMLVTLSIIVTSCNAPQVSSTEDEGSDSGGPYATSQQAIESNPGDMPEGREPDMVCPDKVELWQLCVYHVMDIQFFTPPGKVTQMVSLSSPRNCVSIPIANNRTGIISGPVGGASGSEVPIEIKGKAEDEDICCTFSGSNTLTISGSGSCEFGLETITIREQWGTPQAEILCSCKGGTDCHPYKGSVPLGSLGDQSVTVELRLNSGGDCYDLPIPGGLLSGTLRYCLYKSSTSTGEPDVGLVPLAEEGCP
jgi:hypothetical protein